MLKFYIHYYRFDRHGSLKLKDHVKIAPGVRVDVIGKQDDDAFYFTITPPGTFCLFCQYNL